MARDTLKAGRWVIVDEKHVAVIAQPGHPASVVHYVNPDGTTKMIFHEELGKMVTHAEQLSNERLTIADLEHIPESRRPTATD